MILPDVDALALKAIRAGLPGVRVVADIPADWDRASPLVVVHRVGGSSPDPRFYDRAIMDVQVWHPNRREGSLIARTVRRLLFDACRHQVSDAEGSLAGFTEISGPWCVDPDDSGLRRFIATYQLTARPKRSDYGA